MTEHASQTSDATELTPAEQPADLAPGANH